MAKPEAQFFQSIQLVKTPMTENPLQVQTVGIVTANSCMSIYLISELSYLLKYCTDSYRYMSNISQIHASARVFPGVRV